MKISGTFVCTRGKNHVQPRTFNLTANGNGAGFINLFARIITDDLNHLRIVIDGLIYEHQISLRCSILKDGCGVG